MKCAVHSEAESKGFCRQCGKAMCEECVRDVRGVLYCEECLAGLVSAPQPVVAPGAGNPTLAAILGFVPGLGAVYNGEYMKAIIHVMVFGSIIAMLDTTNAEAFFVPLLIFFIFYQPVEAYRTARAKMLGQATTDPLGELAAGKPVGALFLIGMGVLLLVNNFVDLPWERVEKFWPVLIIAFGVMLLMKQLQRKG